MTHHLNPRDVAERIQAKREDDGRSERQLADDAAMTESTLRRKLKKRPDTLTLGELIRITDTLGTTLAEVASEPAVA